MGCETRLALSGFNRAKAQAPRLVEPAEQQTGTTHRVIAPGAMTNDSPRRLKLEEPLTLSHPVQRLASLADLHQRPSGGSDRPGKKHGDFCPRYVHPVVD